MITVGAFEAKTHLSSLLEKVAAGEEVVITKHGRPVARLVQVETARQVQSEATLRAFQTLRSGSSLKADWRALRDAGRR